MYAVSIYNGSQGFQGYVNQPVTQPLTHKYPSVIPPVPSYLIGNKTQNNPINADMFTNARLQYVRTSGTTPKIGMNTKYIAPIPSSMRTSIQKSIAVGKNINNNALHHSTEIFNSSRNDVTQAKRRVRSSGCVAPKKKGAYYSS